LASETERLVNDYNMRSNRQNNIARNIARLSPINTVNNLMAEFSGTGHSEAENFLQQAKQYQADVKNNYYDKIIIKTYKAPGSSMSRGTGIPDDVPKNVPVLDNYKYVSISQIFQQNWIDIALLGFYCLLFFLCAFISFLRFDVR
jgi:hypothetical protein